MNETNVNYLLVTNNLRKLFSFAVATKSTTARIIEKTPRRLRRWQ